MIYGTRTRTLSILLEKFKNESSNDLERNFQGKSDFLLQNPS